MHPREQGEHIWECKIGGITDPLPEGSDLPMRLAVEQAYAKLTGRDSEFTFSGWSGELDDIEREIIEEER